MTGIPRTAVLMLACSAAHFGSSGTAAAQTALLEVEKGSVKLMQVNDNGGLVVRGSETGAIPASGTGTRLMWYPRKFAFRAGTVSGTEWDDANVGLGSVAMGFHTTAMGENSTALGRQTEASGPSSTAIGTGTTAAGDASTAMGASTEASGALATAMGRSSRAGGTTATAMGESTTASGPASTSMGNNTTASGQVSTAVGASTVASGNVSMAMGRGTTASGERATAMGANTTASGPNSTAMGNATTASGLNSTSMGSETRASGEASTAIGAETQAVGVRSTAMGFRTAAFGEGSTVMGSFAATPAGATGSFVYGDASTGAPLNSLGPNEFAVRAAGGFRFRTNSTLSTGCNLAAGSGAWDCTSSRLAKEDFEDLDGETVLGRLAAIPMQRWRYLGTPAWHVGPTAEDFYAAFELGQGPTTISTVDADGISLRAIQALERRTAELREENAELREENADLSAKLAEATAALRTELEALRRKIETGRVAP